MICGKAEVQEGPRGLALPPVPPLEWIYVDIYHQVPQHSVKTDTGSVKVGPFLEYDRLVFCGSCIPDLLR